MAGTPSKENKMVARHVARAFGGDFNVRQVVHDTQPLTVDVLRCEDTPDDGLISYSTIGLSDHPMTYEEGEFPTRLEITAVTDAEDSKMDLIIGSAAFRIMQTHELVYPGRVLEGYVEEYHPEGDLPHLYFTDPFPWGEELGTLDCDTKQVSFLLAMPLSDSELEYLLEHGDEALDELFAENEVAYYDLDRESVV